MASRLKEDERNERVIRGLLKLEPNRRCINCNSLGPQYVCTNFWTFVCVNCSGIHREFTHRVKSISMAKFTSQEVNALQEGGNQHAKEIYFKEWDAQRNSFPDSSNVERLRDFIKHVYVDRRFSGERAYDKPPKGKPGDKSPPYEGGSKSPPYEDTHERRFSDRSSSGGRSPGYDPESRQYDYKRSPGRPPIINDWRREDRRSSGGDYKVESQSPERSTDLDSSSPPVVRPVREILGENVVPLRISEPPKPNYGKAADGSALTQRTASSSSLASSNGNPTDIKLETAKSLIDFDADPEPPVAPAILQTQQTIVPQPVVQPANSSADNWASFDVAPEVKATPSPLTVNPLESMLSQLSVPASLPSHVSGVQGGPHVATAIPGGNVTTLPWMGDSSVSPAGAVQASALTYASGVASVGGLSASPPSGAAGPSAGLATGQWASLQNQQSLFPANVSQSAQQFASPVGGAVNNQPWNIPSVPTVQGHPNTSMPHAYHHGSYPASVASQPSTAEVKSSGRQALPEDLFTVKYPSYPAPVPGWQMGLPHAIGGYMQYNNVVTMPSFPQSSKSVNPFDVGSESTPVHPQFPSMSSLHSALPNIPPSGTVHPSSLGNLSHALTPPQSSPYVQVLPAQAQTHASALGSTGYMGQQMPPTNMPMPRPEAGSFGTGGAVLGLSNPGQQLVGAFPNTPNPNPLPAGGMGPTGGFSNTLNSNPFPAGGMGPTGGSSNTPNPSPFSAGVGPTGGSSNTPDLNPFPSGGNPFG